jgi:hypothetical protein
MHASTLTIVLQSESVATHCGICGCLSEMDRVALVEVEGVVCGSSVFAVCVA